MSLHQIANHVQSAGRGDDKILVHMTPGEVKGLQAIAMAHGGSLTINPQTGLPEAGILKTILPMVAGFALGPAGFGIAQSALGAGAIVGGATALATGSLSKGLMAGFGAYGGFGIGEGLAAAGANAMGNAGANAAAGAADDIAAAKLGSASKFANTGSSYTGTKAAVDTGVDAATKAVESGGFSGYGGLKPPMGALGAPVSPAPYGTINTAAGEGMRLTPGDLVTAPKGTYGLQPEKFTNAQLDRAMAGNDMSRTLSSSQAAGRGYGLDIPSTQYPTVATQNPLARAPAMTSPGAPPSYMDKVSAGFKDVTSSGDKAWQFVKSNPAPFVTAGLGLAQDLMGNKSGAAAPASGPSYLRPYDFSIEQDPNAYAANDSTAERRYFKEPRYTARPIERIAASGGLMRMAEGGRTTANTLALPNRPPMEQVAMEQAIGQNMSFPMANQRSPAYSASTNRPQMHEVVDPSGGPEVDPYTGVPMFASGGIAHYAFGGSATKKAEPTTDTKYSYNPETMQYTQTTTTEPAANTRLTGNPMIDGMIGLFGNVGPYGIAPNMQRAGPGGGNFTGFSKGFGGLGGATINPAFAALYGNQQSAPQPTTTTEVSGGMMAPAGQQQAQPQMQQANPITPNINVPEYQTPEQQLGLEGFYDMMDAQLAKKGAQMQGMANGGIARFGGGGAAQLTPEGAARQNYARENSAGIIKGVSDDEWNKYKKSQNLSFESAASKAPTYTYNPQNLQFTDNAGKVTMGMQPQFIPMENQYMPDQQLGLNAFQGYANGGMAGNSHLGGYSDGGRLLRGPGDGVSDSIPAVIGRRQPARLADGEFVVPARIVSEIGNGSTEAGARKLYAMMDRVQKARKKSVGKGKVAVNSKSERFLPA